MIPYPSDRMILNSEYDRGYANGQRDILETLRREIAQIPIRRDQNQMQERDFTREEILKLIDSYRGR